MGPGERKVETSRGNFDSIMDDCVFRDLLKIRFHLLPLVFEVNYKPR